MHFYFLADYPSVIKLGGAFLGNVHPAPKHAQINLEDKVFIEVYPLEKGELPRFFVLDEDFINNADDVDIIDLSGGYFLRFRTTKKRQDFTILAQERLSDCLITIFNENGLKVSIESASDFFAEELPVVANEVKINQYILNGAPLIFVELIDKNVKYLAVYSIHNCVKRIFFDSAIDYRVEDNFFVSRQTFDTLKHKIRTEFEYNGNEFILKSNAVTCQKTYSPNLTPEPLIPFLFMEEVLCRGDISLFLDSDIIARSDRIYEYFGDFIGVMPPPIFREYNEVGLIYKKSENRYFVKYAIYEIQNKKIVNFKIL